VRTRREDLLVGGLLLLAVGLIFSSVLGNASVPFGGEDAITGRIFERQLSDAISQTQTVPLWNPHIFGGMPTVDSLSYPLFYPLHALYSLFPRMREIFHHIPLHLVIGGMLAYLLALDLGLGRRSAVLPALAFALTGYLVTLTMSGHGGKIWTCAYLPLVIFTQRRLLREPSVAHAAAAGLSAGVQMLAGHYQIVFYTWLAAGLQLLWHLSGAARATDARGAAGASIGRRLLLWSVVPVIAVAIAAAQFVPAAKYAPWSNRAEPDLDYLASFSFPPGEIVTFAAPAFYGFDPDSGMARYWGSLVIRGSTEYMGVAVLLLALLGVGAAGPRVLRRIGAGAGGLLAFLLAAGLLPLPDALRPALGLDLVATCLILAALVVAHWNWFERVRARDPGGGDRRAEAAGLFLLIAAWAAFLMVGDHLPSYRLFAALPGFDRFRAPHTLVVLVAFAVAMLAGLGLDRLLRAPSGDGAAPKKGKGRPSDAALQELVRSPIAAPPLAVLALLATLLLVGLVLRQPLAGAIAGHLSEDSAARIAAMAGGRASAAGSTAVVGVLFGGALGSLAIACLLWGGATALVVATLRGRLTPRGCVIAFGLITFVELGVVGRDYVRPVLESESFAGIEANPLLRHVAEKAQAAAAAGSPVRVANLEGNRIRPNDPVVHDLHLTSGYHGAPMGAAWDALHSDIPGFAESYLALMGARYLLYPQALEVPGRYRPVANLSAEGRATGPFLIENLSALPRARMVFHAEVVEEGEQVLRRLAAPGHDPRSKAILDRPLVPPLAGEGQGQARITEYGTARVVVETEASARGLLVLSDAYYPGWTATVDGVGEPILRADHHLRGVVLPPGKHRVVFDFDPIENRIGAGISLLTAIAVAAAIALGRRRNAGSAGPVA